MALRHAVLAELRRGPGIGYQVFQRIARHAGAPWQLIEGAVRLQLNKCVDEGLAAVRTGAQGSREVAITRAGRSELRRWAADPAASLEPSRDDLLLRIAYTWDDAEPGLLTALEGRRLDLVGMLHSLTRRLVESVPDGEDEELWRLGIERMRRQAEAELEWAEACRERLVELRGSDVGSALDSGQARR